ncbi:PQQ-like beta-propeller repeat protein [Glaciimonas immobilis]|uniref:Outer membrane protein assembly factor BamB n=1 Tax=Glaciimonas immobilis TaxID=728004 RepID=A0A840S0M3_9BURK|nr:PQQ-like beta-propeller repeat protein [Glaciimonas immobilis]KAF3997226.1 PQQ-like beta-propeller repeat protein [Glaciimonas immobilis]MBB5202271.1 outer membrane protein assembly factor BamB [Glaciimonas immobilis]
MNIPKRSKQNALRLLPLAIGIALCSGTAWAKPGDVTWQHGGMTREVSSDQASYYDLAVDAQGDLYTTEEPKGWSNVLAFKGASPRFEQKWTETILVEGPSRHLLLKGDKLATLSSDENSLTLIDRISGKVSSQTKVNLGDHKIEKVDKPMTLGRDGTLYFNNCKTRINEGMTYSLVTAIGFGDGLVKWEKRPYKHAYCTVPLTTQGYVFNAPAPAVDAEGTVHTVTSPDMSKEAIFLNIKEDNIVRGPTMKGLLTGHPVPGPDGMLYVIGYPDVFGFKDYGLYAVNPKADAYHESAQRIQGATFGSKNVPTFLPEPVIAGNSIYFMDTAEGDKWALSAATFNDGKSDATTLRWTFPFLDTETWQTKEYMTTTPAVSEDGTLYVGTNLALYGIDTVTGKQKWKRTELNNAGAKTLTIGLDGTVYFIGCKSKCIVAIEGDGSALAKGSWPKGRGDLGNTGQAQVVEQPDVIGAAPVAALEISGITDATFFGRVSTLLGASGSTDPDGKVQPWELTYAWSVTQADMVELESPDSVSTMIRLKEVATKDFDVVVTLKVTNPVTGKSSVAHQTLHAKAGK